MTDRNQWQPIAAATNAAHSGRQRRPEERLYGAMASGADLTCWTLLSAAAMTASPIPKDRRFIGCQSDRPFV